MSRAQEIVQFVAGCNKPVSFEDVLAALPGDPSNRGYRVTVAAQMQQLSKIRKLIRTGSRRDYRYIAAPNALVDRRQCALPKPPKQSIAPKPKPVAAAKPTPAPKPASLPPTPTPAMRASLTNLFAYGQHIKRNGEITSEQIAEDIAAFKARGGRIQEIKPGESSESQQRRDAEFAAKGMKAIHQATWHQRKRTASEEPETKEA